MNGQANRGSDRVEIGELRYDTSFWPIVLMLTALFLLFYILTFTFLIDDAYITFRYAEHLVSGHGLVYNVGGEQVEGYSNFLWMVLLALCGLVGFDIPNSARGLQIVCAAATIPATVLCFRAVAPERNRGRIPGAAVAAALLIVNLSYVVCVHMGLETALFALLLVLGVWRFALEEDGGGFPWSGIVFALAALTRPEGFIFPLIVLFRAAILRFVLARPVAYSLRWICAFAAVYTPYFVWRTVYFGRLLPNAFYGKVSTSMVANIRAGLRYSRLFLMGYVWPASNHGYSPTRWIAVVPAILTVWRWREPKRLILLGVTGGYVTFIVLAGGDWMPYNRFFAHISPLLAIMAVLGIGDMIEWTSAIPGIPRVWIERTAVPVLAMMLWGSLHVPQSPFNVNIAEATFHAARHPSFFARQWGRVTGRVPNFARVVGTWMKSRYPPGSLFSTELAGGLAYYSDLPVLDTYGLNDTRIADIIRGGDRDELVEHILERQPDIFTLQLRWVAGRLQHESANDAAVFRSAEFRTWYAIDAVYRVTLDFTNFEQVWMAFFVRRPAPAPLQTVDPYDLEFIEKFARAGQNVFSFDNRLTPYRSALRP